MSRFKYAWIAWVVGLAGVAGAGAAAPAKEGEVGKPARATRPSISAPALERNTELRGESPVWPVAHGPVSLPLAVSYDPQMLEEAPPAFLSEHAACTLYRGSTYQVAVDGTIEGTHHYLYRLNNRAAVESDGEWPIEFDPTFETVTLNLARVHAADGSVRELGPDNVHVRDSNTDFQMYDQYRQVIISYPGLQVGDVVELACTVLGRDPSQEGAFTIRYPFNDPVESPVLRGEVRVRLAGDRTLTHATFGQGVTLEESTDGEFREYRWTTGPIEPPEDDLEGVLAEERQVGLACSTFASWDEVARYRRRQSRTALEATPAICRLVARLTAVGTEEEQAQALCAWVRDKIRYRSCRVGDFASLPHSPTEVFHNCYGDCWDKSQLLFVMLREAGINAEFVFVNSEGTGQIDHNVPSPSADHVFLRVEAGPREHWVDPTATWNAWDQLRRDCYGRNAYFLRGDSWRLGSLPEMSGSDYRIETDSRITLQPDGSAAWRVKRVYHGLAAAETRETWNTSTPAERRRAVLTDFRSYYPQARLTDFRLDPEIVSAPDAPLAVEFEVAAPQMFLGEISRYGTLYEPALWTYLLSVQADPERTTALAFGTPCDLRHTLHVQAPPGESLAYLPEPWQHESRWGTAALEVVAGEDPGQATLIWRLRLDLRHVHPHEMLEYGEFHEAVSALSGATLGVAPEGVSPLEEDDSWLDEVIK